MLPIARGRKWPGLFIATGLVLVVAGIGTVPAWAEPQPKTKDSSARAKPKQVTLTTSVLPAEAKPGETVQLQVTAKLDEGWHIYKYATSQPDDGPRSTEFDLFDTGGLKVVGDWKPERPPIQKPEPVFPNLKFVEFYDGEISWRIALQVPTDAAPGAHPIKVQSYYQICDPRSCSRPGRWTLPDAVVTIVGGQGQGNGQEKTTAAVKPIEPAPAQPQPSASATASGVAAAPGTSPPAETNASATSPRSPEAKQAPTTSEAEPGPVASAAEPAAAAPPAPPTNEVQQAIQGGLPRFLMLCIAGGLLALAMPCVWPMVPVTVNFFVKQGHEKRGKATKLAIFYCLAIIGIFTGFGVFCAFFFEASSLKNLANNPWLNLSVTVLFFLFGLSLLGLFEIRLPNFLLNASVQAEGRGGVIGVIFMALTLTITSFTCTFPVVGGLLVLAAGGSFVYPILGLATFSAVIALPFFLLALSPGWISSMPKSGDWMNAIKVVGGLVEVGAAFKFLNTAEIGFGATPENAWFDAQLVLAIWVVLAIICGIYLLGLFKTDHDHDELKVGPARLLGGAAFLCLALYLTPALFGLPPKSRAYEYFVVGLLPPDSADLAAPTVVAGSAEGSSGTVHRVKATSSDPKIAIAQEKSIHGVAWGMSYEAGVEQALAQGRPILIDFTGVNCANCRLMEQRVLPRPDVVALLEKFVTIQLFTDFVPIDTITQDQRKTLADENFDRQIELTNDSTNPFYVALSPDGKVLGTMGGYREPSVFINFLNQSLTRVGQPPVGTKTASTR